MYPDLPRGLVHALRGLRRGSGGGAEEFGRVWVPALRAVYVCGAGLWVGQFGARLRSVRDGVAGAVLAVDVWAEVEREESFCGGRWLMCLLFLGQSYPPLSVALVS